MELRSHREFRFLSEIRRIVNDSSIDIKMMVERVTKIEKCIYEMRECFTDVDLTSIENRVLAKQNEFSYFEDDCKKNSRENNANVSATFDVQGECKNENKKQTIAHNSYATQTPSCGSPTKDEGIIDKIIEPVEPLENNFLQTESRLNVDKLTSVVNDEFTPNPCSSSIENTDKENDINYASLKVKLDLMKEACRVTTLRESGQGHSTEDYQYQIAEKAHETKIPLYNFGSLRPELNDMKEACKPVIKKETLAPYEAPNISHEICFSAPQKDIPLTVEGELKTTLPFSNLPTHVKPVPVLDANPNLRLANTAIATNDLGDNYASIYPMEEVKQDNKIIVKKELSVQDIETNFSAPIHFSTPNKDAPTTQINENNNCAILLEKNSLESSSILPTNCTPSIIKQSSVAKEHSAQESESLVMKPTDLNTCIQNLDKCIDRYTTYSKKEFNDRVESLRPLTKQIVYQGDCFSSTELMYRAKKANYIIRLLAFLRISYSSLEATCSTKNSVLVWNITVVNLTKLLIEIKSGLREECEFVWFSDIGLNSLANIIANHFLDKQNMENRRLSQAVNEGKRRRTMYC